MPPENLEDQPTRSNAFTVLLILSFVFVVLAISLTFAELHNDYQFWKGPSAPGDGMIDDGGLDDEGVEEEFPEEGVDEEVVDEEPVE